MTRALEHYSHKEQELIKKTQELHREANFYSILRLIIFLGGVAVAFIAFGKENYLFMSGAIIIFAAIFIFVAYKHSLIIEEEKHNKALLKVMKRGLQRVKEQWKDHEDTGSEYLDREHPYSYDLDIFGEGSLFQYINSTSSYSGRERLAEELQGKYHYNAEDIKKRQEAIEELALKADFREELSAVGIMDAGSKEQRDRLLSWSSQSERLFQSPALKLCRYGANVITAAIILLMVLGIVDYRILLLDIILNALLLLIFKGKRSEAMEAVGIYKSSVNNYFKLLELIDGEAFKSPRLQELQQGLKQQESTAGKQLKELSRIINSLKDTQNAYYLIINLIALMDFHLLARLEDWKESYGAHIAKYLEILGELESLSSLAVLAFEQESWCWPTIASEKQIEGRNIGHPLLGAAAVTNDFSLKDPKSLVLITGSNMSGKSTFLRTLGVNLLLSYLGSVVRAQEFSCGIMNIYTCMRVNDDLKESISSFYAELLRIKSVLEATKSGEPVFFLLDEIFKGTNSKDRHKGAEVLINQLTKHNTLGLVSTHDLELTVLEEENPKVINGHFRENYEEDKLKFDYKLRKGYSTTQNALFLMKLIGIETME